MGHAVNAMVLAEPAGKFGGLHIELLGDLHCLLVAEHTLTVALEHITDQQAQNAGIALDTNARLGQFAGNFLAKRQTLLRGTVDERGFVKPVDFAEQAVQCFSSCLLEGLFPSITLARQSLQLLDGFVCVDLGGLGDGLGFLGCFHFYLLKSSAVSNSLTLVLPTN